MVLGLRSKTRKDTSVQVDYIVNVQEIKPWPPSQSLGSVHSILLQWENGDQISRSIPAVISNGAIKFNEPFMLPLVLSREKRTRDNFQKNCLEFYLYESKKDKAAKGQLLGTAIINLADYGIIRDNINISVLVNCKKSSKGSVQPVLYVNVQPFDKDSSSHSPNDSSSKDVSLDRDVEEFVVEKDNDSDISFLSEDDTSSHSSHTVSFLALEADSSLSQQKEVAIGKGKTQEKSHEIASKAASSGSDVNNGVNIEPVTSEDSHANENDYRQLVPRQIVSDQLDDTTVDEVNNEKSGYNKGKIAEKNVDILDSQFNDKSFRDASRKHAPLRSETLTASRRAATANKLKHMMSVQLSSGSDVISGEIQNMVKSRDIDRSQARTSARFSDTANESKPINGSSQRKQSNVSSEIKPNTVSSEIKTSTVSSENKQRSELSESKQSSGSSEIKPMIGCSESKSEWKSKVDMLEEELREAAISEAALYSIVAEHGSSTNKVHAPARRLSRFYLHAGKAMSCAQSASAAKAAVSGLILVSKSCGNDVPRLTFWLSNAITLRTIINQAVQRTPLSKQSNVRTKTGGRPSGNKLSSTGKGKNDPTQKSDDWENPQTFVTALEKVEAWMFYRIVESVWWQTMTPHMQSAAAKASARGSSSRRNKNVLGDQEQGNFSIELWKKAFKDACERLCPIRAGGHECGCLPVIPRLVMEQLVERLDVSMFNAILRESGDEMPTDPVSDPISDPKVLPIPAGKSSFGAGAQLKNAIGNWSRWLSDLFGIEDSDPPEEANDTDDIINLENGKPFKAFRLLNALSDLMMLPIEMLADNVTRKEVCPIFGALVIMRVLDNFVPDEFSPEPIPTSVLEALDTEDAEEDSTGLITFPCTATPTIYSPPPAASLAGFIGEVGNHSLQRSTSSVLRKSYTSDDELDELDSSITSIIIVDKNRVSPSPTKPVWSPEGGRKVMRYQLLRETWRDGQ